MNTINSQQELDDVLKDSTEPIILGFLGKAVNRKEEIASLTLFMERYANIVNLYLVNPAAAELWQRQNIQGLPTYLFYFKGKLGERWLGRMSAVGFEKIIAENRNRKYSNSESI